MSSTEFESIAVKRAAGTPSFIQRGRSIAVDSFFYFISAFNLLPVTSKTRLSIPNVQARYYQVLTNFCHARDFFSQGRHVVLRATKYVKKFACMILEGLFPPAEEVLLSQVQCYQ